MDSSFISVQQKMGEKWIDLEEEIYKVVLHVSKLPIMTTLDCHKEFDMHYNDNVFNFYNIERYLIEYVNLETIEKMIERGE